jgi:predicted transposase YbfD/YdcC
MHFRQFQEAVQGWLTQTSIALRVALPARERIQVPEDQIALDGKTVRGAAARREGSWDDDDSAGLHLVAAYVPALEMVLDQLATDGKGRELAAAELLLGRLPLRGHVYTGDALLTQREVCKTVIEGEGDYLLPVKENQPSLLGDLREAFSPSTAARSGEPNAARGGCRASDSAPDATGRSSERGTA